MADAYSSFPFQAPSDPQTPMAPDISSISAVPSVQGSNDPSNIANDLQVNLGALEVLHGLARRSSYTKDSPVVLKQTIGYVDDDELSQYGVNGEVAVANDEGGDGRLREIVRRLRDDLKTTQEDLVKAVKGWKKDREDYEVKLEEVKSRNDLGKVKSNYLHEKKRLRGQIAALQNRVVDLESKYSSTCREYESKLQGMGTKVMDARLEKDKERKTLRRKSVMLSEEARRKGGEVEGLRREIEGKGMEVDGLSRVNDELRIMLREAQMEVQRLRVGGEGGGEGERRVEELERENERLRKQLENRILKPTRKPPKPPEDFDFGKYGGVDGLDELLEPDGI